MHFYVVAPRSKRPPREAHYPCVVLEQDKWNDFGWVTQYHATHWVTSSESTPLGPVKILEREGDHIRPVTVLPDAFESLDERHCSLGQERRYYTYLQKLGDEGEAVLSALRDIVLQPEIGREFEAHAAFEESLLRYSEARDNYRTAGELFGHRPHAINGFLFHFTCQARGFLSPHQVSFDFSDRHEGVPHRVIAFVGKNGTGKTGVMSEMARQLSGVANLKERETGFWPERPSFSRVVAISYSPFGPFRYPAQPTSSYRYCGLFDQRGRMGGVERRIIGAISDVWEEEREIAWFEALHFAGLFASEPSLEEDLRENPSPQDAYRILRRLSSGHFYAAAILTEITANLLDRSLLLLDEPELYLHPNMVSGLMRALDRLLEPDRFDSYAVVATHSPIVIQELLGRSVRMFMRSGEDVFCLPLEFESFGENLTTITNEVFGVTREDKNFMQILERLAEGRTTAAVERLFGGRLSLNAAAYVRAIATREQQGRL